MCYSQEPERPTALFLLQEYFDSLKVTILSPLRLAFHCLCNAPFANLLSNLIFLTICWTVSTKEIPTVG